MFIVSLHRAVIISFISQTPVAFVPYMGTYCIPTKATRYQIAVETLRSYSQPKTKQTFRIQVSKLLIKSTPDQ